ncbi:MAG: purine-nucleoside phosphorylase, partial [Myxococcales bacterium]|nr:purine-nucleoside phosphorylase [Myxococcales bacterium]
QINLTGTSPLVGTNDERLGPRFPDMTDTYTPRLQAIAKAKAQALGVPLKEGIYGGLLGPTYETPAEVRMLRGLGVDVVGMSTVVEVIAARHLSMDILGISCVTNVAAGLSDERLDHAHIKDVANRVRTRFQTLIDAVLEEMASLQSQKAQASNNQ